MVCVIDFDGTFLINDFFKEAFFKKTIENPFYIINHFFLKRKSVLDLKMDLLKNHKINYPIQFLTNKYVTQWLSDNRHNYDKILLVSASPDFFVKNILDEQKSFDEIHGSKIINLKGLNKLEFIKERWTEFDYMGDSKDDLIIFKHCKNAFRITPKGIINVKK